VCCASIRSADRPHAAAAISAFSFSQQLSAVKISRYVYHRRVQFPETDASGIVHFTNFFKYVEEAEHAMWRAAGLSVADRSRGHVGWPRVAASFEYKKPLRFEDEFDVEIRVVEKTAKTIRYGAVLRKGADLIAEGSLTIICVHDVSGEPLKARAIPPDIDAVVEVAQ
jgi:YbgC/YbaW family acyl-CoA thioester hydrolase